MLQDFMINMEVISKVYIFTLVILIFLKINMIELMYSLNLVDIHMFLKDIVVLIIILDILNIKPLKNLIKLINNYLLNRLFQQFQKD